MNAANFAARLALGSLLLVVTSRALAQDGAPCEHCGQPGCSGCFNFPGPKNYSAREPNHFKLYPPRTCWMWRYTYHYGVHYDRPYDYRTLSDFPWHSRKGFGPGPAPHQELPPGYEEYEEWLPEGATPLARGPRPNRPPRAGDIRELDARDTPAPRQLPAAQRTQQPAQQNSARFVFGAPAR